jgi:hypothetical protein
MYTGENQPMEQRKAGTEIYAAFGTIFKNIQCWGKKS